jgi:hypothetical protein
MSKVADGEMSRAIAGTVLMVHAVTSSSTKRVDEASAAAAKSPCRQAAGHRDVQQAGRARRQRRQIPGELRREHPLPDRQRRRAAEQRRRMLGQPVEAQRLALDLPVEADHANLGEGHAGHEPLRHAPVQRRIGH